ncbi:MAG: hypothetical protein VCE12_12775 [Candidatus Latescibacterota bacterium]
MLDTLSRQPRGGQPTTHHLRRRGRSAAGINYLLARIEEDPREMPPVPPYPVLRFDYQEAE